MPRGIAGQLSDDRSGSHASVGVALSGFLSRKRKYADETRGRLRQKDYRNLAKATVWFFQTASEMSSHSEDSWKIEKNACLDLEVKP